MGVMVSSSHVSPTAQEGDSFPCSSVGCLLCLQSCSSHIFSLCSSLATVTSTITFFLPYYVTMLLATLIGSALVSGGSILQLPGIGSDGHGRSFLQLRTEATPVGPPTTKTWPLKPSTVVCQNRNYLYKVIFSPKIDFFFMNVYFCNHMTIHVKVCLLIVCLHIY